MSEHLYRFRGHVKPTAGIRASVLEPRLDGSRTSAELRLYDPIDSWGGDWGVSAKEFAASLDNLPDQVEEIHLRINSPGGECFEAIAIMNLLRNHSARVVAHVDGLAASSASVIACAADELVMERNSQLMIHDAWAIAMGPAALMRDTADRLDKLSDNLAEVYATKAGISREDARAAMLAETWYSAQEAVDAGLADTLVTADEEAPENDQARFDLTVFNHAGRHQAPPPALAPAALAAPSLPVASAAGVNPPAAPASGDTTQEGAAMADITDEQLTTLRQTAGVADDADVDTALAALAEALEERAEPTTAPAGTVVVDEAAFAQLQEQARLGAEARAEQQRQHRERTLDAAVASGRIAPAARGSWAATLERDPDAEQVLAGLPANTIPVEELGHAGALDTTKGQQDDEFYASIFSKEA